MDEKFDGFQFKQFSIEHKDCAMKVGTDGILLGSWIKIGPQDESTNPPPRFLDIGTGSGLLAIMLAQKSRASASILGIDIDLAAVNQAKRNMQASPWSKRLDCQHSDISDLQSLNLFNVIVSNPPYFVASKKTLAVQDANYLSPSREKARHNKSLDLASLFANVARLLEHQGSFFCVLPADMPDLLSTANKHGLYGVSRTWVYSKKDKPAIRQLLKFTKSKSNLIEDDLIIHGDHQGHVTTYSDAYRRLCKDFYLKF